ncbi:MAG: hypothetical protein II767_07415 [Proteobacteria bacterium]|nr:hypothetical protein [Pseudomonadota bacterium]MBQ4360069.1 hypothetical protein [Pseudomonadota bacterium]
MMPTRLQDGLSITLLQWMRSADADEKRTVVVRISDMEVMREVLYNLRNAGLADIEMLTPSSVKGVVDSDVLSRVVRCLGVCSVTPYERTE